MTKGNSGETPTTRTPCRGQVLSGLARIRQASREDRRLRFTSLMHHITLELLQDSYDALKHNAAAGVDDETWYSYGEVIEDRLPKLHALVQSGRYRAKPSKRI